jgi:hypothetical protein
MSYELNSIDINTALYMQRTAFISRSSHLFIYMFGSKNGRGGILIANIFGLREEGKR